jgi:5-formyltetrahydrofolate cyclo-ligase
MTAIKNADLRLQKRAQRRALSDAIQAHHADQLNHNILGCQQFLNCQRLACYLPNDGEIDPIPIIENAWRRRKKTYLPVLSPLKDSLYFAPFTPDFSLTTNKFGIFEPDCHPRYWLRANQIDLMLLPLVAFDDSGNRLGMGGGFYDRSLAHLQLRQHIRKPYLIGLAHELQKADQVITQSWDIPLDAIATEKRLYAPALLGKKT